jgi:hypothetical protein
MSPDQALAPEVTHVPQGAKSRRWTLNAAASNDHYGKTRSNESHLYLKFRCRYAIDSAPDDIGIFKIDLKGLLENDFIRYDPKGSTGDDIRLRIALESGVFSVQINDKSSKYPLKNAPLR